MSQPIAVPKKEDPSKRRERLENEHLSTVISASLETFSQYNKEHNFDSFQDFKDKMPHLMPEDWIISKKSDYIDYILMSDEPYPVLKCVVRVNNNLLVDIFSDNIKLKVLGRRTFPSKVGNFNEIDNILECCMKHFIKSTDKDYLVERYIQVINNALDKLLEQNLECEKAVSFFKEQISLLNVCKTKSRYSPQFLIFSSLLHSISPHAYCFFRSSNYVRLPSPSTLKLLSSKLGANPKFEQNNMLRYISSKFKLLENNDKTVMILMDEIHLKSSLDYKTGDIVGNAFDGCEAATSACVFMINSFKSSYKDVVHILPCKKLSGEALHDILKQIIIGLENIGFKILAVVSDNHTVNRKAMSLFCNPPELKISYAHPVDQTRNFFFLFDSVHILKCIRNNWLNNKSQQMIFPKFDNPAVYQIASFDSLKEMYTFEKSSLIKYGYGLDLKSLYPSSLERQNVNLALKIFNHNISKALIEIGSHKNFTNYQDTSEYVEIISTWWDIVNVKSPLKGLRLRNKFQEPITVKSVEIKDFMTKFLKWLDCWKVEKYTDGTLTKETHYALQHTTDALLQLSDHCISSEGYSYFLCGKVQTDNLEERFGQYRQLSGSQYHVSVRQIFESEGKLRMQSALPLILKSHEFGDVILDSKKINDYMMDFFNSNENLSENCTNEIPVFFSTLYIDDDEIDMLPDHLWPIITYIAGYCSHVSLKNLKCDYCEIFLVAVDSENSQPHNNLIRANDRGGLKYPASDIIRCTSFVYLIVQKIISSDYEAEFLKLTNQKKILSSICLSLLPEEMLLGHNCPQHTKEVLIKNIVNVTLNILLNNYVKIKNDRTVNKNMPQLKRIKV